jgi:flavin-dependent dehydrogenase
MSVDTSDTSDTSDTIDALIVGGGLAGSAAAITLARAGRKVLLVEKESKPQHKVCGEFLSQEALTYLRLLGVDTVALGAVPITTVRLAGRFGVTETQLPFAAMSLTRRRLDEELLSVAEHAGAVIQRGCNMHSLKASKISDDHWQATLQDDSTITARTVFIATGKHDLHGRPRPSGLQPDLIAFKMYWKLSPEQQDQLQGCVELNLYRGGYCGLQPVERGSANLCCLIKKSSLQKLGGRWSDLLKAMQDDCPHLKRRLTGAEPLLTRPLAASSIPYGFVRAHSEGLWSTGDQAAVIPSFTGDGMSIALHSGRLAAEMYLQGSAPGAFQTRLYAELASQVSFATRLSRSLVVEPQRTLIEAVVRLWPGALRFVANRTRLSAESMRSMQQISVANGSPSVGIY